MPDRIWTLEEGDLPLVATAIHNGHAVRDEVAARLALSDSERLREEDPFTKRFTMVADTRIVGLRSRFEVDLNRPREQAVYQKPEDAWGLHVWQTPPPDDLVARSLAEYDAFYEETERVLRRIEAQYGRFVVFDIHSYNHRREGPDAPHADPAGNPEVNIGTGTMDRDRWAPVIDRFISDLRAADYQGRLLDVRENVKFQGGHFPAWIHRTFPETGCALAIEFKKIFMDECTGEPDEATIKALREALASTIPGVLAEMQVTG
jgi:N-formylglutamate amidohydrolase